MMFGVEIQVLTEYIEFVKCRIKNKEPNRNQTPEAVWG